MVFEYKLNIRNAFQFDSQNAVYKVGKHSFLAITNLISLLVKFNIAVPHTSVIFRCVSFIASKFSRAHNNGSDSFFCNHAEPSTLLCRQLHTSERETQPGCSRVLMTSTVKTSTDCIHTVPYVFNPNWDKVIEKILFDVILGLSNWEKLQFLQKVFANLSKNM